MEVSSEQNSVLESSTILLDIDNLPDYSWGEVSCEIVKKSYAKRTGFKQLQKTLSLLTAVQENKSLSQNFIKYLKKAISEYNSAQQNFIFCNYMFPESNSGDDTIDCDCQKNRSRTIVPSIKVPIKFFIDNLDQFKQVISYQHEGLKQLAEVQENDQKAAFNHQIKAMKKFFQASEILFGYTLQHPALLKYLCYSFRPIKNFIRMHTLSPSQENFDFQQILMLSDLISLFEGTQSLHDRNNCPIHNNVQEIDWLLTILQSQRLIINQQFIDQVTIFNDTLIRMTGNNLPGLAVINPRQIEYSYVSSKFDKEVSLQNTHPDITTMLNVFDKLPVNVRTNGTELSNRIYEFCNLAQLYIYLQKKASSLQQKKSDNQQIYDCLSIAGSIIHKLDEKKQQNNRRTGNSRKWVQLKYRYCITSDSYYSLLES